MDKAHAGNEDRIAKKVKAAKDRAIKDADDKNHRAMAVQKQKV